MPKLSIILINYNTRDILEKCLDNLATIDVDKEIIVVDNASPDGSADMVESRFPQVQLIKSPQNVGLAAGSNLGLKQSSGDYILYLGTDAFPEAGCVDGMLDYMDSHPDVGLATAQLYLRTGELDTDAHRGFPTLWTSLCYFLKLHKLFPTSKIFNHYFMGYANLNAPHEIDLCISHFMLIRKEVFTKIGMWDERFFVFGEDVDMCYRIKQAGFKIMYLPRFRCLHYKGSSIGIRKESQDITPASQETKNRMLKERRSARRLFFEKHYGTKNGISIILRLLDRLLA